MDALIDYLAYLKVAFPLTIIIFVIFRFILAVKIWHIADVLMLLFPGLIYLIIYAIRIDRLILNPKRLGSLSGPIWLGIVCGVIFLIRCILAKKMPAYSKKIASIALMVMLIITIGIAILTPPE
jgi:hypothetical protein